MDDKDWYSKQGIRFQYQPGQPHASINSVEDGNNAAEKPHWLELEDNSSKHLEKNLRKLVFLVRQLLNILIESRLSHKYCFCCHQIWWGGNRWGYDYWRNGRRCRRYRWFSFFKSNFYCYSYWADLIGLDVTELSYFLRYRALQTWLLSSKIHKLTTKFHIPTSELYA